MRVWPIILAACGAASLDATVVQAQQTGAPAPQFVFTTTTALSQEICYWAGALSSNGARIRLPEVDRDPHVSFQYFTCHAGNWAQE